MPSATDLILGARQKSNTERSKFVSDGEVLGYVNERLQSLRDLMIEADPSFYHSQADLVFNNPAGHPAGSATLPADLYRIRGVTQWPDTPNARSIRPLAFSARDGVRDVGYVLDGNCVTIVPYQEATRGPVRVYYTPVLQLLSAPLPVTPTTPDVAQNISVQAGTDNVTGDTNQWTFTNAVFQTDVVGQLLRVAGCAASTDDGTRPITSRVSGTVVVTGGTLTGETFGSGVTAQLLLPNYNGSGDWSVAAFATTPTVGDSLVIQGTANGNDGSFPVLSVSGTTVHTSATGGSVETFGPNVSVSIQRAGTTSTLDTIMVAYQAYLTIGAAISIATKMQKTDLVALLSQQFAAEAARVSEMAANRAGETEAIPVLWRPDTSPLNPWGGWGF